jgi:hypothetical protein
MSDDNREDQRFVKSAEVGRGNPCAPSFARQESVVAGVGAQRTPRPTFQLMESPHGLLTAHWDHEPSAARVGARASWTAATESSESPLWGRQTVLPACCGILCLATMGYAPESRSGSRSIEPCLWWRIVISILRRSGCRTNDCARPFGSLSPTQRCCARGRARSSRGTRFPR